MIAALVLLALLHFLALPKISVLSLAPSDDDAGTQTPIMLPYIEPHDSNIVAIRIDYHRFQQTLFRFYVEGCAQEIVLNDHPLPFNDSEHCQFKNGVLVDLAPFLKEGENTLIVTTNYLGAIHVGPVLFDDAEDWKLTDWLGSCLIGCLCAGLISFIRKLTGEITSGSIVAAGFILYLCQLSNTDFGQYTMDMRGHLEYIAFIATRLYWPKPYWYWQYEATQFYHPPLYYSIQALLMHLANWLGSFDVISVFRSFSLAGFMGFMVFATLTLRRLIKNQTAYYMALLLLVFYPCGPFISVRVDNGPLFYAFFMGCLYFTLRWLEDKENKYFGLSLTMLGLGFATRSNTLILLPVLALAGLYQWHKRKSLLVRSDLYQLRRQVLPLVYWRSPTTLMGFFSLYYGLLVNFGRTAYYNFFEHKDEPFVIGNVLTMSQKLDIKNSLEKFLLLDRTYFLKPFWNTWRDDTGRQYFWNSLLKTSLFGEFQWNTPVIATILSVLLLVVIAYVIVSMATCWRTLPKEWWMCGLVVGGAIVSLMINRIIHPLSCSQDFRFIYPIITGFCGMFGITIEHYFNKQQRQDAISGIVIAILFITASILFYLIQFSQYG